MTAKKATAASPNPTGNRAQRRATVSNAELAARLSKAEQQIVAMAQIVAGLAASQMQPQMQQQILAKLQGVGSE